MTGPAAFRRVPKWAQPKTTTSNNEAAVAYVVQQTAVRLARISGRGYRSGGNPGSF